MRNIVTAIGFLIVLGCASSFVNMKKNIEIDPNMASWDFAQTLSGARGTEHHAGTWSDSCIFSVPVAVKFGYFNKRETKNAAERAVFSNMSARDSFEKLNFSAIRPENTLYNDMKHYCEAKGGIWRNVTTGRIWKCDCMEPFNFSYERVIRDVSYIKSIKSTHVFGDVVLYVIPTNCPDSAKAGNDIKTDDKGIIELE